MVSSFKYRLSAVLALAALFCLMMLVPAAAADNTTMVLNKACWTYTSASSATSARGEMTTFGEEVVKLGEEGSFTKVKYKNNTRYIISSNLEYKKMRVFKSDIMVSPSAAATSDAKCLGHLFYGAEVDVLSEVAASNGTKYIKCFVPTTYTTAGAVKKTNVTGYINKAYLEEKTVIKLVNATTYLYAEASTSSAKTIIYFGEEVEVLREGSSYSKVRYNDKEYYMTNNRLDSKTLGIMAGQVPVTREPRPSSGTKSYVYFGTDVPILSAFKSQSYGIFYQVEVNGSTGYIREFSKTKLQHIGLAQKRIVPVSTKLYNKANASSGELATIPSGADVEVVYPGETWTKVLYNGKTGFVYTSKLDAPEYIAYGAYYPAGAKLYSAKDSSGNFVNEKVKLLASYTGRKMALVEASDGSMVYISLNNLTKLEPVMDLTAGCWTYADTSASTAARKEQALFGEEVTWLGTAGALSRVNYKGNVRYVMTSNLAYKTKTVKKADIMVSTGAYATSSAKTLGHLYYGDKVEVLGEKTASNGTKYIICSIPETYASAGKVKNSNVIGYINSAYLEDTKVPKTIKATGELYTAASTADKDGNIYIGEEVEVLLTGSSYSKVRFNDKIYFVLNTKLEDKKLYVTAGRVSITKDPKVGSATLKYVYWDDEVTVLGEFLSASSGKFYHVTKDGTEGYIREFSDAGLRHVGHNQKRLIPAATTMYNRANASLGVAAEIPAETEVTELYVVDTWTRISYDGQEGYVYTIKLNAPEMLASGPVYASGEDLYSSQNAIGELNEETVNLLATYAGRKMALVENANHARYYISLDNLTEADLAKDATPVYSTIPNMTLHIRPEAASEAIEVRYMSELLYVDETEYDTGSWIRLLYDEKVYYLWEPVNEQYITPEKSIYEYQTETVYQQEALELALSFLDKPTAYGHGASRGVVNENGYYVFDCSGFSAYVMNTVMKKYIPSYHISRDIVELFETGIIYGKGTTQEFSANRVIPMGEPLDESLLKPGDLLYFNAASEQESEDDVAYGKPYTHVGIYMGKGEFIHATHSWGGGVCVMVLKGEWEREFVQAIRVLPSLDQAAPLNKLMYVTKANNNLYSIEDGTLMETLDAGNQVTLNYTNNSDLLYTLNGTAKRTTSAEDCWAQVVYNDTMYFTPYSNLAEEIEIINEQRYSTGWTVLYKERSSSSENFVIYFGTPVSYRGRYSDTLWYKVNYNNADYYVYAANEIEEKLITQETYDALMQGSGTKTVSDYTKLRAIPSADGEIIESLTIGDELVLIKEISTTWTYVRFGDIRKDMC